MKAPIKWLKDYVPFELSPKELAAKMVQTGNGVEGIEELGENMKNVVVGKILALRKHPDADRLQICEIDVGAGAPLQIVTGATNVFEGAMIPVAKDGALLPNGVKIKTGVLRGVLSEGMLCSGGELCLKEGDYPGAEEHGILILKEDVAPGADLREILMLADTVIEFEIGANRPDCLSMIGIAREAGAAAQLPVTIPEPKFSECEAKIHEIVKVDVEAPELCPRYMARAIKNVKIAPSPRWMVERLRAAGVRSINNLVDITNFVMLETGQPMHAFDAAQIAGGHIIVRRAKEGEEIVTLDGKRRSLTAAMLLITDESGPIGIAGVMGAENSEIKETTTTVVFEAAKFMYGNIRQTSRALGLATEASMRFSKGVEAYLADYALRRACQLVELLGAGEIVGGCIDVLAEDLAPKLVKTSVSHVNSILGTTLLAEEIREYLGRVYIETQQEGDALLCKIPPFRADIDGGADIAEEVARIFGYDNIPMGKISGEPMEWEDRAEEERIDRVRECLCTEGFYECVTYSFIGEAELDQLNLQKDHALREMIRILNPLGDDKAYMRTTLIPDILKVAAMNLNRKCRNLRLYEVAKTYHPKALPLTELPGEPQKLVFAITDADFFKMKAVVEKLLQTLRIKKTDYVAGGEVYFHPGRAARIMSAGKQVGEMGQIHPDVQKNFGIDCEIYVAQLDLDALLSCASAQTRFVPLPKYPALERDLALIVDAAVENRTVRRCIMKHGGKYIESVELFDVYAGEQLGEGKKSLAYSLRFRASTTTLRDEDIVRDISNIIEGVKLELGAILRS